MQKAQKELDNSLDKIILLAEKYAKDKNTDKEKILKLKKILDNLQDKITEPSYRLFEAEALISESKGNHNKALEHLEDALLIEGDIYKYTSKSRDLIEEISINSMQDLNQKDEEKGDSIMSNSDKESVKSVLVKQRAGKIVPGISGWLLLYELRIIILPIVFIANYISMIGKDYGVPDKYIAILSFSLFIQFIAGIAYISMAYPFFKKKKIAKNLKYLELLLAISFGVVAWVLYSANQADFNDAVYHMSNNRQQAIWAGIWALYWFRSKRVKATFVN